MRSRGASSTARAAFALAFVLIAGLVPAAGASAATFTVDTTAGDVDGSCADADCSFLDAIAENNANNNQATTVDTIDFDGTVFGSPQTIQPAGGILINEPVTINGFTGGACTGSVRQVALDLSSAGSGMAIQTGAGTESGGPGGSTVCGLAVYNGATQVNIVNSDGNELLGNRIGLDWSGTPGGSNVGPGVSIQGSNNLIGGTSSATHRNVISGNASHGIHIQGAAGSGGNLIRNNTIGLDATGAVTANGGSGITVGSGAKPNTIGGTGSSDRNTISGNSLSGIDANAEIEVKGNRIGTLPDGTDDRPNGLSGIQLGVSADGSVIGGEVSGGAVGGSCDEDCNLISGNNGSGLNDGGIVLTGTDSVEVAGNYIGTDGSGTISSPNDGYGILVRAQNGNPIDPAEDVEIGTGTEAGMNLVSANGKAGIRIQGLGTTGVDISGNNIGTGLSTLSVLANDDAGVVIAGDNVDKDNTPTAVDVGVANELANAISGTNPVLIERASGNVVANNLIGLSRPPGSSANGSPGPGVSLIDGADHNQIGSTQANGSNTIAGRTGVAGHGLLITGPGSDGNEIIANFIGTDPSGAAGLGNAGDGLRIEDGASENVVGGGSSERNVISGNGGSGVQISGAQTALNVIDENRIGSSPNAASLLANGGHGVEIDDGATDNDVLSNFLSGAGDGMAGVMISGADDNLVEGNRIGTDWIGVATFGPAVQDFGVVLENGASSNEIGQAGSGFTQPISNNDVNGVLVTGSGTDDNVIAGNRIGVTTANIAAPNGDSGIRVTGGAGGTVIGGGSASAFNDSPGNTISANGTSGTDNHGVELDGAGSTSILGNRIGLNSGGDATRENLGNGIFVTGGSAAPEIGGSGDGEGNVVSGNALDGIALDSTDGAQTFVQGNVLGPGPDGTTPLTGSPGQDHGLVTETSSVIVGGTGAGEGNTIARNQLDGIAVRGASPPFGVEISGNSIFSNGNGGSDPGIDLFSDGIGGGDGVTPNDNGTQDADVGANDFQNFPVITGAEAGPAGTAIEGNMDSTAFTQFRLEFFSSPVGDPSGNGEGQTFLGTTQITTDGSGLGAFDVDLPVPAPSGHVVTATATDITTPLPQTSEFSAHVVIAPGVAPDTEIVDGPANGSTVKDRDVSFEAEGTPAADTAAIECRLEGPGQSDGFAACGAPTEYTGLADGTYTWSARAVDGIGNADATPASRTFTVAGAPPKVKLKVSKKLRVNKLKAKAICKVGPCAVKLKGKATVKGKGKARKFKLKPKKANLADGRKKSLKPKFKNNSKSVKQLSKLLKSGGKGSLKLTLVATNDAGKDKAKATVKKLKPA